MYSIHLLLALSVICIIILTTTPTNKFSIQSTPQYNNHKCILYKTMHTELENVYDAILQLSENTYIHYYNVLLSPYTDKKLTNETKHIWYEVNSANIKVKLLIDKYNYLYQKCVSIQSHKQHINNTPQSSHH